MEPYFRVVDLHDTCAALCVGPRSPLSSLLLLTATASDGATWERHLPNLSQAVALPGGPLAAHANARHYQLTATLPQSTGNEGEGLSVTFSTETGLMDSTGAIVTSVLGETFGMGGSNGASRTPSVLAETFSRRSLPFTGTPGTQLMWAGSAALGGGVLLLLASRRRRQP